MRSVEKPPVDLLSSKFCIHFARFMIQHYHCFSTEFIGQETFPDEFCRAYGHLLVHAAFYTADSNSTIPETIVRGFSDALHKIMHKKLEATQPLGQQVVFNFTPNVTGLLELHKVPTKEFMQNSNSAGEVKASNAVTYTSISWCDKSADQIDAELQMLATNFIKAVFIEGIFDTPLGVKRDVFDATYQRDVDRVSALKTLTNLSLVVGYVCLQVIPGDAGFYELKSLITDISLRFYGAEDSALTSEDNINALFRFKDDVLRYLFSNAIKSTRFRYTELTKLQDAAYKPGILKDTFKGYGWRSLVKQGEGPAELKKTNVAILQLPSNSKKYNEQATAIAESLTASGLFKEAQVKPDKKRDNAPVVCVTLLRD